MTGSVYHSIAQVSLVLGLMVALIFALAWLAKKTQTFGLQGGKHLTLLQTLPLGQKEKVVLIKLNGTQILLGVTTHQVSTLWTSEPCAEETKENEQEISNKVSAVSFSDTLKNFLNKNKVSKDIAC